uniref:Methyltransferase type 12 domain-containing protein n=1 Tax=Magnetococcus massalia (strain MO-1) TaxID=451514 RepID=A0A1S7LJC0_MAGMO|nr:conserved protein of unknown function [Candidatus Magnetococcus massalia]
MKGPEFYSEGWQDQFHDMRHYAPMARHTFRWALKLAAGLNGVERIADFGCGTGELLLRIKQLFPQAELQGCDFAEGGCQIAAKRLPHADFRTFDLRQSSQPFPQIADLGFCLEVIEHIDDDQQVLGNLSHWCKYLVLTVPAGELDQLAQEVGHLRHYSAEGLRRSLPKNGWEVVQCREWGFPFAYPWYSRLRNRAGTGVTMGQYSLQKRLLTHLLYLLFFLNDPFTQGGNKVFVLARSTKL